MGWAVMLNDVVDGLPDFTLTILTGIKTIKLFFVANVV